MLSPQVQKLLELVSPRVGVVRSLTRVARGVGEPSPPILYHAVLANFDFKKADDGERATAGKGLTENDAMAGAIGEAIERYCAYHAAVGSIQRVSQRELDRPSLAPPECVLYSASQYARRAFPYAAWNEDVPTGWLSATGTSRATRAVCPGVLDLSQLHRSRGGGSLLPAHLQWTCRGTRSRVGDPVGSLRACRARRLSRALDEPAAGAGSGVRRRDRRRHSSSLPAFRRRDPRVQRQHRSAHVRHDGGRSR